MYFDYSFLIILALAFLFGPYIIAAFLTRRLHRIERALRGMDLQFSDLQTADAAQAEEIAGLRREILALRGISPADAPFDSVPEAAPAASAREDAAFDEQVGAAEDDEPVAPPRPATDGIGARLSGWMRAGGLERQFGAVLPVWIGGIALAFAGFFLVKYSIENELVGPGMRVVLGLLLGGALLAAARWVGTRSTVESAERIAQSLAGAGIAVLYVSAYAATALYDLVPPLVGFAAMAGVTGIAVVMSLRHGPPIAMLGLLGGFLTPALIRSDNASAVTLFIYLYVVFGALMIIIRRKGWWLLALPALLLAFVWVVAWMLSDAFRPDETLWAGLFLAAVAGTIVAASRERYSTELAEAGSVRGLISLRNRAFFLNSIAVAGAFGLMAALAFNAQFGVTDWVLFGVLAMGVIALAYFDPRLYGYTPWAAMAVNLIMLAGWDPGTTREVAIAVTAFGTLYALSGLLLFGSASTPLLWAGLSVTSALGYYLLAYFRVTDDTMTAEPIAVSPDAVPPVALDAPVTPPPVAIDMPLSTQPVEPLVQGVREVAASIPHIWGGVAMALALLFFGAALRAVQILAPSPAKDRVIAAFALATTAFIALALTIELQREFLSVAIAAELLAVTWVAGRTRIASLRPIAGLLAGAFAFLLFPQIMLLVQLSLYSILDWRVYWMESVPIVDYPWFQLGLPSAFFLAAAYLLRRQADGRLVRVFEGAAVALFALWGYYAARKLFHPGVNVLFTEAGFLERGTITNVLFLYGVACLMAGRWFARSTIRTAGAILAGVALFRIVYFDLLIKNPLWVHDAVPGTFLVNALAVTFLLPLAWTWIASREMAYAGRPWVRSLARWTPMLMLVFAFAWLSLEIRRFYQGPFLDGSAMSDAELYTYSVVWLIFGLGLLFVGTLRGSQMLRFASLAVMLATVSKVFLVDAGSLTGLYRVFSFLGLGLSLIGLSYFYSRFVFGGGTGEQEAPVAPTRSG